MLKRHKNFKITGEKGLSTCTGCTSSIAGSASCVSLLFLAFLLVNPLISLPARALETEPASQNEVSTEPSAQNTDENIMPAATTTSTVSIAFSPTSASGTVTPVDSTGAKAKVDVKATVRVQNSGGYSVYVGSNSSQLKNGSNVIDSVTSATTYANLPVNRWGYSFSKTTSVADSYIAMPATLRSTPLDSNSSTNIEDETRTYTLSFAANIGSDKPAGTYTNQVTMSVVSSPLEVTGLTSLTNLQDMTSEICAASAEGDEIQLKDTRDGKYYWVAKLKDGKCWMTQNLDLDLSTSKALTSADSDVSSNWTPEYSTLASITADALSATNVGQRFWSLGNYRITNPTASSSCGSGKNSAANCPSQFTAYTTPITANKDANAHYILGNHYQWNAATAGTGGTITSGQATGSICPKGWKLPTSNSTSAGSFGALINAGAVSTNVAKLTSAPYYFVRGGYAHQGPSSLYIDAGNYGYYWSSTPTSTASNTYNLTFSGTSRVSSSASSLRYNAYSVRCLAR